MKTELLEYLTKEAKKLRQNSDFISINKHLTGICESDMPTAAQIDGVLVAFINYVGMSQCIDYALSYKDFEKKELKQIEQEENVELTDFESALFSAFSYAWQEYLSGKEVNVAKWAREHSAELLEVAKKQKPACAWSEEDENSYKYILEILLDCYAYGRHDLRMDEHGALKNRLKSLKERYTWKPSIAQLNALSIVSKGNAPDDIEAIVSLYNDLKKLREE